mmetsp:Transcript_12522/g.31249  ORF Transcript_12522/g.31249 Transcript_12522/m.31249 type:complete len:234 (+) Transcript_12522:353-1054(+)
MTCFSLASCSNAREHIIPPRIDEWVACMMGIKVQATDSETALTIHRTRGSSHFWYCGGRDACSESRNTFAGPLSGRASGPVMGCSFPSESVVVWVGHKIFATPMARATVLANRTFKTASTAIQLVYNPPIARLTFSGSQVLITKWVFLTSSSCGVISWTSGTPLPSASFLLSAASWSRTALASPASSFMAARVRSHPHWRKASTVAIKVGYTPPKKHKTNPQTTFKTVRGSFS